MARGWPRRAGLLTLLSWLLCGGIACGAGAPERQPLIRALLQPATATALAPRPAGSPGGSETPPGTVAASVTATGTAEASPEFGQAVGPPEHVNGLALGASTPVRSVPSLQSGTTVRTLTDRDPVVILREVRGERFVVGDQTWPMATQEWTDRWYLVDGGYVYAGFIYVPRPSELDSISDHSGAHWVDVDVSKQTATAMVGDRAVHVAAATTGKPGFRTPPGEHVIPSWGRKFSETMTSSQAAIQDPAEQYNVQNVLYTQYFDDAGDALHLNYWQPDGVFGSQASSHGCVGLELHDAQYFWLFAGAGTRVMVHPVPAATATATATPPASSTPAVATLAASGSSTAATDRRATPAATARIVRPPLAPPTPRRSATP